MSNKEKITQLLKKLHSELETTILDYSEYSDKEPNLSNETDIAVSKQTDSSLQFRNTNGLFNLTIATLVHQLNQPLAVINLLLENTLDNLKKEHISRAALMRNLKNCLEETQSACLLTTELREFARDIYSKRTSRVNLLSVARRIKSSLDPSAKKAGLKIVLKIQENLTFAGNVSAFEEIFFIMIQNSIEAAAVPGKCRVVISSSKENGLLTIKFTDNCGGIKNENIKKLFEPAFTTKEKHTGLGLPIVHNIISNLGGNIDVNSRFGKGTTFLITIPISDFKKGLYEKHTQKRKTQGFYRR
jgi:signal transduction histidine kinase